MNPTTSKDGFVYIIQVKNDNKVKIGFSANPRQRLLDLQVASPFDLVLAKVYPGTIETECWFHRIFSHLRIRGEWFRIFPEEIEEVIREFGLRGELMEAYTPAYVRNKGGVCDPGTELLFAQAECSALIREFDCFIATCPEYEAALGIMKNRHAAILESLSHCRQSFMAR